MPVFSFIHAVLNPSTEISSTTCNVPTKEVEYVSVHATLSVHGQAPEVGPSAYRSRKLAEPSLEIAPSRHVPSHTLPSQLPSHATPKQLFDQQLPVVSHAREKYPQSRSP